MILYCSKCGRGQTGRMILETCGATHLLGMLQNQQPCDGYLRSACTQPWKLSAHDVKMLVDSGIDPEVEDRESPCAS
jgi:hypothetical protein